MTNVRPNQIPLKPSVTGDEVVHVSASATDDTSWRVKLSSIVSSLFHTWGTITGTLSDQTDLQNALDGKVDDAQVLTNVPLGAVFTDTQVDIQAGTNVTVDKTIPLAPIINATGSVDVWGDITGTLSNQTDLQSALDGKVDDAQVLTNVPAGALFTDTLPVWGAITGTLSNQTDLQNELDAKVDIAGDTMTGLLVLSGDPVANLGAATKQTVDAKEDDLGNPSNNGDVLASTIAGVRSWVTAGGGNSIYSADDTILTTRALAITDTVNFGSNLLYLDKTNEAVGVGTVPNANVRLHTKSVDSTSGKWAFRASNLTNDLFWVSGSGVVASKDGYWIGVDRFLHNGGVTTNVFNGRLSGNLNTTGNRQVGIGYGALRNSLVGEVSVGIGYNALTKATAFNNVGIGAFAADDLVGASGIVAIGANSASGNITGTDWVVIGFGASNGVTGSGNTFIGSKTAVVASGQLAGASNSIAIGFGSCTTASNQFVAGIQGGGQFISEVIFGGGATNTTGAGTVVIHRTSDLGGSAGGDVTNTGHHIIAGGAGEGLGLGASVLLQTAPPTTTSSTTNPLVTGLELNTYGVTIFKSFTLATLPTVVAGGQIYVSDATGSGVTGSMCFGNGTSWIDPTTGIAVA